MLSESVSTLSQILSPTSDLTGVGQLEVTQEIHQIVPMTPC